MNRNEFMDRLEYLLSDVPEEEKQDALAYYRDYLEDAGDDEAEAVRELGSPERIASIIRSDLAGSLKEGGGFTERGYEDERFRDPNYQVATRKDLPEEKEKDYGGRRDERPSDPVRAPRTSGLLKLVLWVILIFVAAPFFLGAGGVTLGIVAALLGILFAAVTLLAVLTVTLLLGGIAICVVGMISMAGWIPGGLLILGAGIVTIGFGLVSLMVSILFYGRFLPWLIRCVIDGISGLVHRRRKTV